MQKLALLVVVLALGPSPSVAPSLSPAPVRALSTTPQPLGQPPGDWNLIFSDEFNGTALDSTKWTPGWFGTGITGPVNAEELACYDSTHVRAAGDGNLHLLLDATPNTCKGKSMPYTGALVSSNGLFQYAYGYVEFHVYAPASSPGQMANWPATWSNGQSWPGDGENDTMEGLGGPACYHFHSPAGGPGTCARGDFTGWHTFASDWEPGVVTYFYDGNQVGQITSGITSAPQYLVLEYTLNGSNVATVPTEMLIDYVRVWTPASAPSINQSLDTFGGVLKGGMTATGTATTQEVFVRGGNNVLWSSTVNGDTFGGWTSRGGLTVATPGAASTSATNTDVFVEGYDAALWQIKKTSGTFGSFTSLGGVLTAGPTATVGFAASREDVFIRGADRGIWWAVSTDDGTTFGPGPGTVVGQFSQVGGVAMDSVAAVAQAGAIDIYLWGADNALWRMQVAGA